MFVTELDKVEKQVTELAHLGIDPLETALSWGTSATCSPSATEAQAVADGPEVHRRDRQHLQRRDPLAAGLRWDRMSDSLTAQEVRRLYRAMMETLQDAVKHRGSSLADEQYVDLFGRPGEFQHFQYVCGHEGERCPRCRQAVLSRSATGAGRPSTAPRARCERTARANRNSDASSSPGLRGEPGAA